MIRYQVYSINKKGELIKPMTSPLSSLFVADKYFTECFGCAIVSIDEHGTILKTIKMNTYFPENKNKQKYINKR